VQGFEFLSGVARRISYDNTKIAVAKIIGGGQERRLTRGFCQLKSHYLFEHHFCRPARGNEKGVVEGQVKFTRLNFFVPVPQVRDLTELNARLRQQGVEDRERRLRGHPAVGSTARSISRPAFLLSQAQERSGLSSGFSRVDSLRQTARRAPGL
jgi:transposase